MHNAGSMRGHRSYRRGWAAYSLRTRLIAAGVVVVAAGGIAYYVWAAQPIVGRRVVSEANFPVYTPRRAPSGYRLVQDETRLGDRTLSYVFVDDKAERTITVTMQPTPSKFEMSQIVEGGSINSTAVASGMLYNLSSGDASKYVLDTGDTLVFLTSPDKIDTATINGLAASLVRQN